MKYLLIFIAVTMTVSCAKEPEVLDFPDMERQLEVMQYFENNTGKKSLAKICMIDPVGVWSGIWWNHNNTQGGRIYASVSEQNDYLVSISFFWEYTYEHGTYDRTIYDNLVGDCDDFDSQFQPWFNSDGTWINQSGWAVIPQGGSVPHKLWGMTWFCKNDEGNGPAGNECQGSEQRIFWDLSKV